jgi:hypothetical protein
MAKLVHSNSRRWARGKRTVKDPPDVYVPRYNGIQGDNEEDAIGYLMRAKRDRGLEDWRQSMLPVDRLLEDACKK